MAVAGARLVRGRAGPGQAGQSVCAPLMCLIVLETLLGFLLRTKKILKTPHLSLLCNLEFYFEIINNFTESRSSRRQSWGILRASRSVSCSLSALRTFCCSLGPSGHSPLTWEMRLWIGVLSPVAPVMRCWWSQPGILWPSLRTWSLWQSPSSSALSVYIGNLAWGGEEWGGVGALVLELVRLAVLTPRLFPLPSQRPVLSS